MINSETVQKLLSGDNRVLARLITLAENSPEQLSKLKEEYEGEVGKAHVIGITGPPGSGKSTLVDQLTSHYTDLGKKVGVVAVDPSSPFSGGAVLGDRIRMQKSFEKDGVFIRSMASRGALGGLSSATADAVFLMELGGFDPIIIETVGVGQAEIEIVRTAHTCVVVLVPGLGDSVQSLKAVVLEIADLFAINKSDREGADLIHKDLKVLLSLDSKGAEEWEPKIYHTVATTGEGINELVDGMIEHKKWVGDSKPGTLKRLIS